MARLGFFQRRQMGFTLRAVISSARKLSREQSLPSLTGLEGQDLEAAKASMAETIAADIMEQNKEEWAKACGDDPTTFIEDLIAFIMQILPFILAIFGL